jgi:uncharacterized protein involved in outer membrane biogenesis
MTRNWKIFAGILLAGLLAVAAGGMILLDRLFDFDAVKEQVITAVQGGINRKVRYGKGDFSIRFGPSFTFDQVEIMEKEGSQPFFTAQRLKFKIALFPLLEKQIVIKELLLEKPSVRIVREQNGKFNISDLFERKKEDPPLKINGLRTKRGGLTFIDRFPGQEEVTISLTDIDLSLSRFERGKECTFKVSALTGDERNRESISLSGSAHLSPPGTTLADTSLRGRIVAKHLDLERFWPYYQQYVSFKKITGRLNIDSDFKGKAASFTSRGQIRLAGLTFDYPRIFHTVLTPGDLNFKYDLELNPRDLTVKSLDFLLDGLRVKGNCALRDLHSGDLHIAARASTSSFDLEKFHQYIPFGVIENDTAEFIEKHIKGGIYRLDEGILNGRVSQIRDLGKGDNFNALFIRGRVEKGLFTYGQGVPTFNNIKGELELRGKNFNLQRFSGNFGASPFTLDGRITDYPLERPSRFPFKMVMSPRQPEASWLLDRQKTGKLLLDGPSTLRLSGDGFTSAYHLSGDWDLSRAAYSYPDFISKPAGRKNTLTFKGSINKEGAKLSAATFSFAPLSLTASADYRFAGRNRISWAIRTNPFPAEEISPFIPKLNKYHPSGRMQATISGLCLTNDIGDIRWAGEISFADASLKPLDSIAPFSNMKGIVRFDDKTLKTSQMTVRIGTSVISGRGMLVGSSDPAFNLDFTSPALFLPDLGLRLPNKDMKIRQVSGSLSLKDNNLVIRSLSGQVNNSTLSIKGNILDIRHPKATLSVNGSNLELADLQALTEMETTTKGPALSSDLTLKAAVTADTVKAGKYVLEKVKGTATYENRTLSLQPFECSAYGGRLTGKGRIEFSPNEATSHQFSFSMERLSTEQLTKELGFRKQEITGALFLSGDFTAKGSSAAEIKKTALGTARLRLEQGSIKKFAVLSKVFSILNVSQLFKGHLPDMVSGGMPFNKITATLSARDGHLYSQDLFVDSNAMNISVVGKIDLVKDEVEATIGVQPLQTVDKVVSRIPVVGWILTGGGQTLITTFFEAKGELEDPEVKAVPVQTLAKEVFNIFKRIFQLPAKLITDTGEVIMGK